MWLSSSAFFCIVLIGISAAVTDRIQIINEESQGYQVECCDSARCFGRVMVNGKGGTYDFDLDRDPNISAACSIWYNGPSSPPMKFDGWKGPRTYVIKNQYLHLKGNGGTLTKVGKLSFKLKSPSK